MSDPSGRTGSTQRTSSGSDPEIVLAQALRAMAGGRAAPSSTAATPQPAGPALTVTQILLIAAIVGLLIGAGLALLHLVG